MLPNVLDVQLSDTMRAHIQHDGVYTKDRRGKKNLTVRILHGTGC